MVGIRHLEPRIVLVRLAGKAEDDVVGIEVAGRGEPLRRLPFDALAQMEGEGLAVGRDVIALGDAGLDVDGAALELEQPVVNLARSGVERGAGEVDRRIEVLRAPFGAKDQRFCRCRAGTRHERGATRRNQKLRSHDFALPDSHRYGDVAAADPMLSGGYCAASAASTRAVAAYRRATK